MPQELRVVCCFQCRKFQSDIVKKAKKWTCKLCGAQQSLVKEYARGSGRECRLLVQQLSNGSLQADQMERFVAEQVLSGEVELPVVENPIREESDRLVASHKANRKIDDDQGSKWNSFCVNEDAEEGDIITGNGGTNNSESSSWTKWGKGNVVDRDKKLTEKPKNSTTFTPKYGFQDASVTSKLFSPIGDFHQMDKQAKNQFKLQSKNSNQSNFASSSKALEENKKPLFSFKPQTSTFSSTRTLEDIGASQLSESIALKRTPDSAELTASQSPMMCFAKKSKRTNFKNTEFELNSPIDTQDRKECFQNSEPLPEKSQSSASSSKWSKFIPQTDQEDDDFT